MKNVFVFDEHDQVLLRHTRKVTFKEKDFQANFCQPYPLCAENYCYCYDSLWDPCISLTED